MSHNTIPYDLLPKAWLEYVTPGNTIFLVKEKEYAVVVKITYRIVDIGLKRVMVSARIRRLPMPTFSGSLDACDHSIEIRRIKDGYAWTETWRTTYDGRGFDSKRLLAPIYGNFPSHLLSRIISTNCENK